VEIFRETLNFCISDVDPIEEGEHEKNEEDWEKMNIDLPEKLLLFGGSRIDVIVRVRLFTGSFLLRDEGSDLFGVDTLMRGRWW